MAIRTLRSKGKQLIEHVCRMYAMERSGLYDFFVRGGMVGYRLKDRKAFFRGGVSYIPLMEREKALAWEKHVGLRSGN
jgi:hypothetical protein